MNPLYRMYTAFSRYWDTMVPKKPRYGNYHLRGKNGRWRKLGCPVVIAMLFCSCIASPLFGYNPETDKIINTVIDGPPIEKGYESYSNTQHYWLIYDYCKIDLYISNAVPYESPGEENFFCREKDGSLIMIQSLMDISANRVSDATLKRIKTIMQSK